jgi:hypothetical protein
MDLKTLIQEVETLSYSDDRLDQLAIAVTQHDELAEQADQLVGHFVDAARESGCSWAQIGEVLGVTKQAAQQRHTGPRPRGRRRGRDGRGERALSSRMLRRFSDRARTSVIGARSAARELGHDYIGTEHLLLGLYTVPDSVAATVLSALGLSRQTVVDEITELIGQVPAVGPEGRWQMSFTPRAKKALERALKQSRTLGHDYIGTEHILLGLLDVSGGIAAQILANHDITPDKAHTAITKALKADPTSTL